MRAPGHLVMPKLGLTMEEGKVAKWLVQPGQAFAAGDILVVVETDKIANDVEAPSAGVLDEVLVAEGEVVPVSAPIARWHIENGAAVRPPSSSQPRMPVQAPRAPQPAARAERQEGRRLATPYARRLARDAGIDLARLRGSGPHGRIKAQDVDAAIAERQTTAVTPRGPDALARPVAHAAPASRTLSLAQIEVQARGLDDLAQRFAPAEREAVLLALVGMACARGFPGSSIGIEREGRTVPLPEEGSLRTRVARLYSPSDVEMMSGGAVLVSSGGDATLFAPAAPAGWPAALGLAAVREVLTRTPTCAIEGARIMTLSLSYDSAVVGNANALALLSALKTQLEDPLVLLAG